MIDVRCFECGRMRALHLMVRQSRQQYLCADRAGCADAFAELRKRQGQLSK